MEDIVAFARKNGLFSSYFPDGLYIGDNVQEFTDIAFHELLFEDMGYIRTWSFKVDNQTGKIIPYDDGFKFKLSGFNPENMRKKLAMVDEAKAKAGRRKVGGENHEII